MSSSVEQIKERLSIADVVGGYIKLEKAGSTLKAKCPFHNEKTASFFVSPNRGTYYCFGCGAKGDMFSFVQAFEGTDFMGALKTLAEKAGVEIVREDPKERSEREKLFEIMETASKWFESNLAGDASAMAYLAKRGIGSASIGTWKLGLAPKEWRALHSYLSGKGYPVALMEKAGLVKRSDDGRTYYDRFRGRIQFPILDSAGRTVAFSGRTLSDDPNEPKYLNSPETPIFVKSRVLYGMHKAKEGIRKFGYAILVEGQMDLVMSHQAGFGNTVATSGTALSFGQVDMVRMISPNLVLAYDGDEAGLKAAHRAAKLGLARGMEVKIARLPDGVDPADAAQGNAEELKKTIKDSTHAIEYFLEEIKKGSKDGRTLSRRIVAELLPLVALIESSVTQSHYVGVIAKKTAIKEEALMMDLSKISREQVLKEIDQLKAEGQRSEVETKPESLSRLGAMERRMAGVVLWQRSLKSPSRDPVLLVAAWEEASGKNSGRTLLEALSEEDKHELIFEAEAYYDTSQVISEDLDILLSELRQEYLKNDLASLIEEMSKAEDSHDHVKALALLKRSQDVSRMIHEARQRHHKTK